MTNPRVCAIEWDGRYLAASIEEFIFVFSLSGSDASDGRLYLQLTIELVADGGHKVYHRLTNPQPVLLTIAGTSCRIAWTMWQRFHQRSLLTSPAIQLYYDPAAEFFDRSADLAEMIVGLAEHFDMNQPLVARPS